MDIGCGEISEVVEGRSWPFKKSRLYHRVQDYSKVPGLYDQINFDFSSKYRIVLEFDGNGEYSVNFPDKKIND